MDSLSCSDYNKLIAWYNKIVTIQTAQELFDSLWKVDPVFTPFRAGIITAVSLGKLYSELDTYIREIATGYLEMPVYQEISVDQIGNLDKAKKLYKYYADDYLVITKYSSIEEKVCGFSRVFYIVDVRLFKFLMASSQWESILEVTRQNRNHFLVFGTILDNKYIHHTDIPKLDVVTLVPQFLSDTEGAKELEVGIQQFRTSIKKKKYGTQK